MTAVVSAPSAHGGRRGPRLSPRTRTWLRTLVGALITCTYLLPVYWMLATSVKKPDDIFALPPQLVPLNPTVHSYTDTVLSTGSLVRGLANSTVIATFTTLVTLVVAVPAAYGLARLRLRFVPAFLMLFLVVQMVPAVNLALPMFVIFSQTELVNTYQGLVIANASLAIPLAVIVLRPYFLSVPHEIIDAAKVDGCTTFGAFRHTVLPISLPGLVTVAVISFLGAWGEFVFALALAGEESMQPVTVVLSSLTSAFGTRWNDLMAASTVVAVPVIAAFIFLQRFIVTGLTAGATKD